jgi:ATP-dependent exoDNAse (exonuclease V) beta subunit
MIIDAREREEALDAGRSFIVEAPAGSGKTGLLVQRFLRLLSIVDRPESVVAITFTRKAAAEMKQRILDALADVALNIPREEPPQAEGFKQKTRELAAAVLEHDRQKGWKLQADTARLQIQTVDSLCALLTRQMPVLSEFGGFGEVIEEASELYLRAARNMLTSLAEGDEAEREIFRRMVLHFDNDVRALENQVVNMLSKRDQWEHLNPTSDHQLVQDCYRLLASAEIQLRAVFQRTGKVDFTEIARAARRALGKPEQPSDLLYALDYRFQHLLVDEFQDTSRSQFELVKALTEQWSMGDDHTLFLVGDPMQSIYRFREADVALFLRCWQDKALGAVSLTPLRLQTNFRTTQNILAWVETHFAAMMPEDDPVTGAVEFRNSYSGRQTEGIQPRLVAHINDRGGGEEADEIVDIIKRNPDRRVAILVRSRPQTTHILPALRKAGIAYEAVEIETLQDQQHVIDVLSLTRALTNLADRVAWLACLRAPWCGLTLADLSALAEGRRDETILDLLSDAKVIASLSVNGRWRAVRTQEILAEAVARVGRLPLRNLVEQTWQALGGLAAIAEANQREDVDTLFRLMDESDEGGIIRDFSLLNRKLEFLYARPAVTECKVVVMTVYQAKGLEFDIVILPRLEKSTRTSENELLVWVDSEDMYGEPELDIAAMPQTGEEQPEYTRIKNILDVKDKNETKRLFYVACTRAINELHVIGSVSLKKDGTPATPGSGTFLRLIWDSVREEFDGKLRREAPAKAVSGGASRSLLRRLPLEWHAPASAKSVAAVPAIRRAVASQRQVSYHWVGDTSRHVGTIVHEMLKRIAGDGLEEWTDSRLFAMRPMVGAELLRLGVPANEAAAAGKQVLRAVVNTITSHRGRWILSRHAEDRSEWAIAGRVNQYLVSGTVDRAFRDEAGTYWIIDYKNSEHGGSGRNKFLANEKERYQAQLEQYAAVISKLMKGPISLGLYFPLLDAWVEWKFAEAAGAASRETAGAQ